FFEYQTIDALVSHLLETREEALITLVGADTLVHGSDALPPKAPHPVIKPLPGRQRSETIRHNEPARADALRPQFQDVAIIGLAGRYPGAADVHAFWQNLKDGRHCITEIPRERWDWRA